MQAGPRRRTLVVANRTAATPLLLEEIQRRAVEQPTSFVLLRPTVSASREGSDWTLMDAVKSLRRAASGPTGQLPIDVEGREGGPDAFQAVKHALADGGFDDVIISTLPKRASEWLRRGLPRRVQALNVPVTVITQPSGKRRPLGQALAWNPVDQKHPPEETD